MSSLGRGVVAIHDSFDAKWQQLAREGRHMEAVKECRARSGLSLLEARGVVERFVGRPLR